MEKIYINGLLWKVLTKGDDFYIIDTPIGPERIFKKDEVWYSEDPIDKEIVKVILG